jgi:hypothetical protein
MEVRQMGRFLRMIQSESDGSASEKKAKFANEGTDELMNRLAAAGISIAIDNATGGPLLIFNESGAEAVRHVAKIYRPFDDIVLTEAQRRELTADLDYYEKIIRRRLYSALLDERSPFYVD